MESYRLPSIIKFTNNPNIFVKYCLDHCKKKSKFRKNQRVYFYVPTRYLSKEKNDNIENFINKFTNKKYFYMMHYKGLIEIDGNKINGNYGEVENTTEICHLIYMSTNEYYKELEKYNSFNELSDCEKSTIVSRMILFASTILRTYYNELWQDVEKYFDYFINYFDFQEAMICAYITNWRLNNISTNYGIIRMPLIFEDTNKWIKYIKQQRAYFPLECDLEISNKQNYIDTTNTLCIYTEIDYNQDSIRKLNKKHMIKLTKLFETLINNSKNLTKTL